MHRYVMACIGLLGLSMTMAQGGQAEGRKSDKDYDWLEDLRSDRSLSWVKGENDRSLKVLEATPTYGPMKKESLAILEAKDKIPFGRIMNEYVYNFWQDANHVKGIWRRTNWADYVKGQPQWELILDIDALAKKEGKNYVYGGSHCLRPDYSRCLIRLSEGGSDASFWREFDLVKKEFVVGGFELPASKSGLDWLSLNEVLFDNATSPATQTDSGYAMETRLWKRGQNWEEAPVVFKGVKSDVSVGAFVLEDGNKDHVFYRRGLSFYTNELSYLHEGKIVKLPLPIDVEVHELFKGQLIVRNRKAIGSIPEGSLIAVSLAELVKGKTPYQLILSPNAQQSIDQVSRSKDYLYVNLLDNVRNRVARFEFDKGKWQEFPLALDNKGAINLVSVDQDSNRLFLSYEDFLTPQSLLAGDGPEVNAKPIMQIPPRFNSEGLVIDQRFATSSDGTKIPYFIIHKKDLQRNGENPTLLYGYGGFEVSLSPSYMAISGKLWLERGGVYVLANIRGGGEFGPRWHQAALLENRQKAFDDFAAIAKQLIADKVTSPRRLGIQGGSNGGLLMGVSFTQHPDLFEAVVCQVPLLDMMRYHKLLAGASWVAEYGNPDDPKMRSVISKYSPFQNLDKKKKYPEVFFVTSTADDRVHPAHARKMAARMSEFGKSFYYYENIEGGHSASADLQQRAHRTALEYSYLWMKLGDAKKASH